MTDFDKVHSQADADLAQEVRHLREEVARLSSMLDAVDVSEGRKPPDEQHPWLKIAATIAVTFALGKLIQTLRLPTATTAAIPLITNQVNKHIL